MGCTCAWLPHRFCSCLCRPAHLVIHVFLFMEQKYMLSISQKNNWPAHNQSPLYFNKASFVATPILVGE